MLGILMLFKCLYPHVFNILYLVPGASNNGGEDSPGSVITSESGLAHARAIVNDKSGNILVTHLVGRFGVVWEKKKKARTCLSSSKWDQRLMGKILGV